jgi:DNA-binding transcriptional MerR regulator
MTQPHMGNGAAGYSIRVVSRLTGISADTLRMWERRYGFPKPDRNSTGVRVYAQDHVERLLMVSRALKAGYRAGEVIHQSRDDLAELLASATTTPAPATNVGPLRPIMEALLADDVDALRTELRRGVASLGPRAFVTELAGPLVEHVGEEWAARRLDVRHEHLLTQVLGAQLANLLSAYEGNTREPVVLLATLPGEQHSLGLGMVALYVAVGGATPRILGTDTPPDQIVAAANALGARAVGISLSPGADLDSATSQLGWILSSLPADREVWAGGARAKAISSHHPRLRKVVSWQDLDAALARLSSS